MAENLLYLCPKTCNAVPEDVTKLVEQLKMAEFIGEPIEMEGETHYRPGEEFLTLVTFLGCSPVISLGEPGKTGDEFCHIAVDGPLNRPRFVAGDNLKTPRCPGCGHRFEQWRPLVHDWEQHPDTASLECPDCSRALTLPQLRWRKCAGFGRFFIKVWGVFESEAVPNPNLLSLLEKSTGLEWQHFYIRRLQV